MVSTASLRPPARPTRSRTTDDIPRSTAAQPLAARAARILGRADPRLDGILRAPRRRGGDRLSGRRARLGGEAVSASRSYDIVIIGSIAEDRKSTRLNSSHSQNSYAVFCFEKKKNTIT